MIMLARPMQRMMLARSCSDALLVKIKIRCMIMDMQ